MKKYLWEGYIALTGLLDGTPGPIVPSRRILECLASPSATDRAFEGGRWVTKPRFNDAWAKFVRESFVLEGAWPSLIYRLPARSGHFLGFAVQGPREREILEVVRTRVADALRSEAKNVSQSCQGNAL
mgnify:CR=1 FL=1